MLDIKSAPVAPLAKPLNEFLNTLARRLKEKQITLSTAESLTGGLVSHLLTSVPGSSTYFERGANTYSNQSKLEMAGVPFEIIIKHGAVSQECALAMASGIRRKSHSTIGIATTGIAGPDGGTAQKPVGLVWAALSAPQLETSEKAVFKGNREEITWQAVYMALNLLSKNLDWCV